MMNILEKCPKKSKNVAYRIIDNEAVIVIPEKGIVRVLNKVGSEIWELSDGKRKISEIVSFISDKFNISIEEANKDIVEFIQELVEKEMIILE